MSTEPPGHGDFALHELRAELLQALPLFADIPLADLRQVLVRFEWSEVPAGTVVMDEGDESGDLFLVVRGVFEVSVAGTPRVKLAEVEGGELIGEAALFRRSVRRSARVEATASSEIVRLESLALAQLAAQGNAVPAAIEAAVLRTLARRIRISNALIERRLKGDVSQHQGMRWFGLRGVLGQ